MAEQKATEDLIDSKDFQTGVRDGKSLGHAMHNLEAYEACHERGESSFEYWAGRLHGFILGWQEWKAAMALKAKPQAEVPAPSYTLDQILADLQPGQAASSGDGQYLELFAGGMFHLSKAFERVHSPIIYSSTVDVRRHYEAMRSTIWRKKPWRNVNEEWRGTIRAMAQAEYGRSWKKTTDEEWLNVAGIAAEAVRNAYTLDDQRQAQAAQLYMETINALKGANL